MLAAFDMALIVLDYRSNGYGVAASINNPGERPPPSSSVGGIQYTFADIGDRLASALKATIRVSAFEGAAVIAQIIGDNGHAIQLSLVLSCSRNRM